MTLYHVNVECTRIFIRLAATDYKFPDLQYTLGSLYM